MSQTWNVDLISPTGTSPSADIQRIIDGFDTLRSTWSGASEPAAGDLVAYMYWADTTSGLLKLRNAANSAWIVVGTLGSKYYGNLCNGSMAKLANYTVVATDRGLLISCTGTFTLTYTAAATLGDGFTSVVRNDGTGVITLDPNSAELIDGVATVAVQPGATDIVYCDGSGLKILSSFISGQLAFPASQNASSNVNVLDDYEEGTWTPSVGGTATYSTQLGTYTKIGRMVSVTCRLTINVLGTGLTNAITGLPFTSLASPAMRWVGPVVWTTGAVAPVYVVVRMQENSNQVSIQGITAANANLAALALLGNGTEIHFTLTYEAA